MTRIQESTVNRLNSLDYSTIRTLSDDQIYELLHNELDLLIGPVTQTTRHLYERILSECVENVNELHLIQAKYRRTASNGQTNADEFLNDKENSRTGNDTVDHRLNESGTQQQLTNYSFTEDEANAEIGRQIRFGMSSTPIAEPKHTRFQEAKTVSFNYLREDLVEQQPQYSGEKQLEQEDEDEDEEEETEPAVFDYHPLATKTMHTVQATLGPRPRITRTIVRNFAAEQQQHQARSSVTAHGTDSTFFRNVCILAVVFAVFALYIAYKLQDL